MMEALGDIAYGLSVAILPANLWFAFVGALLGTLIGALPGLGPAATIAILLPLTIGMSPTSAMIMFAGIYMGAMYGGSITTILINTPGETSSVVTALDGYPLALQGRAGAALGMSAISSFVAGTLSVILMMLMAPLLATFALSFGPPEYFALISLGLTMLAFLGGESFLKAIASALLGLLIGLVGIDPIEGQHRFTLEVVQLLDGVDFVTVAMGLFAVGEILVKLEQETEVFQRFGMSWRSVYPTVYDIVSTRWVMVRATVIGFLIGALPGTGPAIASFVSYSVEKSISRHPERFGKGEMAGVVGPEGANNAASVGAMVPLLTLGIPGSGATAVMLGAMMLYGLHPGPLLMKDNPELFWGVIASMYIGNAVLLVMNLPLIPIFASALRIPYRFLYPFILLATIVGVYSLRDSVFDVGMLVLFGLLGYGMRKLSFPAAPMLLALILGPMVERALNQSLTISHGNIGIFFTRPISATLLVINVLLVVAAARGLVGLAPRRIVHDALRRVAILVKAIAD